jgi:SHS2 domain-containing protein
MPEPKQFGYEEIEHTADWALRAWAPDLETLFVQAAEGMNHLAGMALVEGTRIKKRFELQAIDHESLLVEFLAELLYYSEIERLGFERFDLTIGDDKLSAEVEGGPIAALKKEIKAVTYYDLEIRENETGLEVDIVFDV